MARKNLLPDVDVTCTTFVLNAKGYKEATGEHPMQFTAAMWEIVQRKSYPSREFRLADTPIEGFELNTGLTEEEKMKVRIAELEAILRQRDTPSDGEPFTPKTRSELTVMNKTDLIAYCVAKHKTDPALYKDMLKRDLVTEAEK